MLTAQMFQGFAGFYFLKKQPFKFSNILRRQPKKMWLGLRKLFCSLQKNEIPLDFFFYATQMLNWKPWNWTKKPNNNNKKNHAIVAPPARRKKVKADGGSKCTTGGAERFSQHTKRKLTVFMGPAVLRRHEAKPKTRNTAESQGWGESTHNTVRLWGEHPAAKGDYTRRGVTQQSGNNKTRVPLSGKTSWWRGANYRGTSLGAKEGADLKSGVKGAMLLDTRSRFVHPCPLEELKRTWLLGNIIGSRSCEWSRRDVNVPREGRRCRRGGLRGGKTQ